MLALVQEFPRYAGALLFGRPPRACRVSASLERSPRTSGPCLQPGHRALLLVRTFTQTRHPPDRGSRSPRRPGLLGPAFAVDQLRALNYKRQGHLPSGSNADGRQRLRSATVQNERPWPDVKHPLSPYAHGNRAEGRPSSRPWAAERTSMKCVSRAAQSRMKQAHGRVAGPLQESGGSDSRQDEIRRRTALT